MHVHSHEPFGIEKLSLFSQILHNHERFPYEINTDGYIYTFTIENFGNLKGFCKYSWVSPNTQIIANL